MVAIAVKHQKARFLLVFRQFFHGGALAEFSERQCTIAIQIQLAVDVVGIAFGVRALALGTT